MIRITRVDATDPITWAILVGMDAECFGTDAPPLTDNSGEWWLATHTKEHAAYGCIRPSANIPNTGYLSRSGVLPDYRGLKLQQSLIKRRTKWAKERGWQQVITDTADNPASGNSLIACGFRLFRPNNPWALDHSIYWRKTL